jgi:hypothetical protein
MLDGMRQQLADMRTRYGGGAATAGGVAHPLVAPTSPTSPPRNPIPPFATATAPAVDATTVGTPEEQFQAIVARQGQLLLAGGVIQPGQLQQMIQQQMTQALPSLRAAAPAQQQQMLAGMRQSLQQMEQQHGAALAASSASPKPVAEVSSGRASSGRGSRQASGVLSGDPVSPDMITEMHSISASVSASKSDIKGANPSAGGLAYDDADL